MPIHAVFFKGAQFACRCGNVLHVRFALGVIEPVNTRWLVEPADDVSAVSAAISLLWRISVSTVSSSSGVLVNVLRCFIDCRHISNSPPMLSLPMSQHRRKRTWRTPECADSQ